MRKKHFLLLIFSSLVALLAGGEWFARVRLGLGTPPLYVSDALTEYRLKPDQEINRFGNRIVVNQFFMRSASHAPPVRLWLSIQERPGKGRGEVRGANSPWSRKNKPYCAKTR